MLHSYHLYLLAGFAMDMGEGCHTHSNFHLSLEVTTGFVGMVFTVSKACMRIYGLSIGSCLVLFIVLALFLVVAAVNFCGARHPF
eukprot:3583382-Amphidinium_carterae.1